MTDPTEVKILEFFEHNYNRLKIEGGHALTEDIKEQARQQVIWYWRKLKDLANKISDAEVRLSLPNQKTPKGRTFSIDGVVDIVRQGGLNHMYDIKTHDPEHIQQNKGLYEEQLNVYAYIWQELRRNKLDFTAVISTAFPAMVKNAMRNGSDAQKKKTLNEWNPVVPITVDPDKVKTTIKEFGKVVDEIEDSVFPCQPLAKLKERVTGTAEVFATNVCRNCDGRFSCESYNQYARTSGKNRDSLKYFRPAISTDEQEDWLEANSTNPK